MEGTPYALLIILFIIVFAMFVGGSHISQKHATSIAELRDNMNNTVREASVKSGKLGPRGLQGRVGPRGDRGISGGVHQGFGRLVNQEQNLYLDRTARTGTSAIAFLNKNMNATNQFWTHDNNGSGGFGTLRNKYGGNNTCLTGDKMGNVFIEPCSNNDSDQTPPNLNQQWMWSDIGNFVWGQDKSKCMSIRYAPMNSTNKLKNGKPVKGSGDQSAYKIVLEKCSDTNVARQIFVWQ